MSASARLTSEELAVERMKMGVEEMRRKMKNRMDNFSIIAAEYAYPCKDLLDNPEARLKYWIDKRD